MLMLQSLFFFFSPSLPLCFCSFLLLRTCVPLGLCPWLWTGPYGPTAPRIGEREGEERTGSVRTATPWTEVNACRAAYSVASLWPPPAFKTEGSKTVVTPRHLCADAPFFLLAARCTCRPLRLTAAVPSDSLRAETAHYGWEEKREVKTALARRLPSALPIGHPQQPRLQRPVNHNVPEPRPLRPMRVRAQPTRRGGHAQSSHGRAGKPPSGSPGDTLGRCPARSSATAHCFPADRPTVSPRARTTEIERPQLASGGCP